RRYLGLHLPHSQPKGLASTARLRVMQWNCAELQGFYPAQGLAKMEGRRQIAALISQWQPQIICIQDFTEQYYPPATYSNIALLADSLGYRYYNLSAAGHPVASGNPIFAGTAIFSKLPLVACGAVPYPARQVPEHIVWANMLWNGKTIRIATTHFASMHLGWRPQPPLPPHLKEDSAIITGSSKLNKLQHFQAYHVQQARQLRHFLDTCSLPTLLGADLNSTPASWAYQQVKANYTDAFLAKGWGLGKTYKHGWPGLRIDYLLASPEWRVARFWQSAHSHSDHHVLMAEFFIP
ncbi:MAG TPA: endonuclease/exonuclease/phosphatase family protein, partial [Phnomibacter sp.]|nr:endonuclease/exonuclease/phosphatase family protein [Phnomibacter sp.]